MAKNLETMRRTTITNLFDLSKELEKLIENTKKEKFKEYLYKLKEKVTYNVNNNKDISRKDLKKVYKLLQK